MEAYTGFAGVYDLLMDVRMSYTSLKNMVSVTGCCWISAVVQAQ
mgnify:CR=1 FL=1